MAELRIHLVTIICIRLYILLITVGLLVSCKINKKISLKEKSFQTYKIQRVNKIFYVLRRKDVSEKKNRNQGVSLQKNYPILK